MDYLQLGFSCDLLRIKLQERDTRVFAANDEVEIWAIIGTKESIELGVV